MRSAIGVPELTNTNIREKHEIRVRPGPTGPIKCIRFLAIIRLRNQSGFTSKNQPRNQSGFTHSHPGTHRIRVSLLSVCVTSADAFLVKIRGAGPCRGGVHTLHGCARWSPISRIRVSWRAWRLPRRWPDGGRRSTVVRWTRRRAVPAYAPVPDLT